MDTVSPMASMLLSLQMAIAKIIKNLHPLGWHSDQINLPLSLSTRLEHWFLLQTLSYSCKGQSGASGVTYRNLSYCRELLLKANAPSIKNLLAISTWIGNRLQWQRDILVKFQPRLYYRTCCICRTCQCICICNTSQCICIYRICRWGNT